MRDSLSHDRLMLDSLMPEARGREGWIERRSLGRDGRREAYRIPWATANQ